MPASTEKGFPYPEPTDPDKPRLDIEALARKINEAPGIEAMTSAQRDVLTTLWKGRTIFNMTTARIEVNKSGEAGDWVWVLDAKNPVPVAAGGTGRTVAPSMVVDLASTVADSPLNTQPRPGVTGILPPANGGTGGSTSAQAREQLSVPSKDDVGDPDTDFVAVFKAALG